MPLTFPRTDWTGVGFGFPPYEEGQYVYELAYAAYKASIAWKRAEESGDWTLIDRYCWQLCVYDKAIEL